MAESQQIARIKRAVAQKHLIKVIATISDETALTFKVLGSKGTLYSVSIPNAANAHCTCIDFSRNKARCKHLHFIYVKVFKKLPPVVGGTFISAEEFQSFKSIVDAAFNAREAAKADAAHADAAHADAPTCRNEADDCAVCFDSLLKQNIFICACCKNGFHQACIAQVRHYHNNCPLCRAILVEDGNNQEAEDADDKILIEQINNLTFNSLLR